MDISDYKHRRIIACDAIAEGRAVKAEPNLLLVSRAMFDKLSSSSTLGRSQVVEKLQVEEPSQENFCLHAFGMTPEDLNNAITL